MSLFFIRTILDGADLRDWKVGVLISHHPPVWQLERGCVCPWQPRRLLVVAPASVKKQTATIGRGVLDKLAPSGGQAHSDWMLFNRTWGWLWAVSRGHNEWPVPPGSPGRLPGFTPGGYTERAERAGWRWNDTDVMGRLPRQPWCVTADCGKRVSCTRRNIFCINVVKTKHLQPW